MCTQKQDTRFSWRYWKKNWKQLFDWDFLNIHWWECLLYSEYIFLGLQCYFLLIAPEPWSFDLKIRAIRPMVRWRKIEDYLKKERTNQLWPLCAVSFSGVRSSAILPSGIIWYYLVSSGIIWYHLVSGIIISPSSGVWGWSTPAALAMSSLSRNSANIEFLKFCGFLYLTFWYFAKRTVRIVSFCFVKKCNKQTLWHPFTHYPPPPPQVIEPHQEKLIRNKPNLTAREFVTVDPECDRMIGCTELA